MCTAWSGHAGKCVKSDTFNPEATFSMRRSKALPPCSAFATCSADRSRGVIADILYDANNTRPHVDATLYYYRKLCVCANKCSLPPLGQFPLFHITLSRRPNVPLEEPEEMQASFVEATAVDPVCSTSSMCSSQGQATV
jgi:hypothetical protein